MLAGVTLVKRGRVKQMTRARARVCVFVCVCGSDLRVFILKGINEGEVLLVNPYLQSI
jgi:hypothetical protein